MISLVKVRFLAAVPLETGYYLQNRSPPLIFLALTGGHFERAPEFDRSDARFVLFGSNHPRLAHFTQIHR